MSERRSLYKVCRIPTVAESLALRSKNEIAERQLKQRELFQSKRGLPTVSSENECKPKDKKTQIMAERLKKWKEEKIKKLEAAKKTQKPPFKVGVLQRKVTGSPLLTSKSIFFNKKLGASKENLVKPSKQRSGVVTRSQAESLNINITQPVLQSKKQSKLKNEFCKIENNKRKPLTSTVFQVPESIKEIAFDDKITSPFSISCTNTNFLINTGNNYFNMTISETIEEKKIQKDSHEEIMDTVESKQEVKAAGTPPADVEPDGYKSIYFSPFVTIRSGKKSKKKKSLSIDVDKLIEKEEKEFQCRIFSFRKYIECETKRLLDLSNKWKCIYVEFPEVPKEIEGDIDCVVGKTQLLTSDKFKQFKDLIDKCEKGDPLIKIDDLQGFQDWVTIEVERVDEEFYKLEQRKCNNWCSPESDKPVKEKEVNKGERKKYKRPSGKSNIRSHILAARKLLKEKNSDENLKMSPSVEVTTPGKKKNLRNTLSSETKRNSFLDSLDEPSMKLRSRSKLEVSTSGKRKSKTPRSLKKKSYERMKENQTPVRSILKKTPKTGKLSKTHVTFDELPENQKTSIKGLDEKYFKPALDDGDSPFRFVLRDMGNRRLNF